MKVTGYALQKWCAAALAKFLQGIGSSRQSSHIDYRQAWKARLYSKVNTGIASLEKNKKIKWEEIWRKKTLYLILLPGILWIIIFCYVPMAYVIVAFQKYNPLDGIFGSQFVGLQHFKDFITGYYFERLMVNTLKISLLKLLICFPAPVIFAIFLNEVKGVVFKKVVQTCSYLPHFISWIVVAGFLELLLSPTTGVVNNLIVRLGGSAHYFMSDSGAFIPIVLITSFWVSFGWDSIVYLAAISGINQELYEAATIDGYGRFGKMWHITLPGIRSLIIILLILNTANILNIDYGQILAYIGNNAALYEVGDVIDTFVYRTLTETGDYSFATAVGLFKGVISMFLIIGLDKLSKKAGEEGIF